MENFKNLSPGSVIYRNGREPVDLRTLPSDKLCLKLYLQGFKHIAITKEGAALLQKCPKSKLEELIQLKKAEKKTSEVKILMEILKANDKK
ncbi:hypothetical protein [Ornithobacterium rhinotracheale]|uniref:hypothetical protein n=1 Tax=Ornithobacterium rhinotracheale TaxID=28251 RepID=UPI00129D17AE|nr:hypothetical protein [Ornithobacterium rhinotracheale]MRJ07280.1 hypothetical protein [Ornithobacterium rhinotracheale]UOH77882.1 hypothetical protein MT996_00070 [Ornithobacterium rhinotracheale]